MPGAAAEERVYWDMSKEPLFDSEEMAAEQWRKLIHRLAKAKEQQPYWAERLEGIDPLELRDRRDFAAKVPLFTKDDYRQLAEDKQGNMHGILQALMGPEDAGAIRLICTTSGTTGTPTPYPFSPADEYLYAETTRRSFWRMGLRPGDVALQAFGLSMFVAGIPVLNALSAMGVCMIPVGAEAGRDAIIKNIRLFRPRALLCTPSLAEYLAETGDDMSSLGLEMIVCAGEPGAAIPEVRERIERTYGARLFDFGAGLGGSCGHPDAVGMHWVVDDLAMMELVDPETHEHIPMSNGAIGLAVFTPLEAPGFLGIRQTNGDIMQVHTDRCPCGRSGFRYSVSGRTDDMLKVKGVMVYPASIASVINRFAPEVTGEFRIQLDEPPPRVVPPLRIRLEYGHGQDGGDLDALGQAICDEMSRTIRIRPTLQWCPPGTLGRTTKKKQVFEKLWEDS